MTPSPGPSSRAVSPLGKALCGAAACVLLAWGLREDVQPDLYFHLAAGRWIHAEGLPRTNVFLGLHPEHPFVNHEWAGQALAWPVWQVGGARALALGKVALAAVAVALAASAGRARRWARLVVLVPLAVVLGPRILLRPELVAWLGVGLNLALLHRDRWRPRPGTTLALCAYQVLWANCHGTSVLGPGLVLAGAVGAALAGLCRAEDVRPRWTRAWAGARALVALAGLQVAAALLHPYGPEASFYAPWRRLEAFLRPDDERLSARIVELTSPFDPLALGRPEVALGVAWALAAPLVVLGAVRARRLAPAGAAAALALVVVGLAYVRTLPLVGLALAGPTAAGLAALAARAGAVAGGPSRRAATLLAAAWVALALALARGVLADRWHETAEHDARAGLGLGDFLRYDEAAAALDRLADGGAAPALVFNNFGSGHFLLWARAGRAPRPVMCGNLELYPPSHLARYRRIMEGQRPWAAALDELGVDVVLLDHRVETPAFLEGLLAEALLAPAPRRWALVHADGRCVVLRRAGPGVAPLDVDGFARAALARAFRDERPDDFAPTVALRALGLLPPWSPRPIERLHLARLLERLDRPGQALALARRARDLGPRFVPGLVALGELERRAGDPQEAQAVLERAASLAPGLASPWVGLGQLALARGDAAGAARAFEAALARDPRSAVAAQNLAAALAAAGDPVALRRALHRHGTNVREPIRAHALGLAAQLEGDLERAEAELARATGLDPALAPSFAALGEVRHARGDHAGAAAAFEAEAALTPGEALPWRNLGVARWQAGAHDLARDALARAAAVDPREVRALVYGAQLELDLGRAEAARRLVDAAAARAPADRDVARLRRRLEQGGGADAPLDRE